MNYVKQRHKDAGVYQMNLTRKGGGCRAPHPLDVGAGVQHVSSRLLKNEQRREQQSSNILHSVSATASAGYFAHPDNTGVA